MRSKREMEGIQSAYYALNASGDALSSAHGPQIANWRSASSGRRKGSAELLGRDRARRGRSDESSPHSAACARVRTSNCPMSLQ